MSTIKVQNIQHTASSTNAIALASDGTCTANITNNLSNRNLIINGAMQVAQRKTSHSTNNGGYHTVDRFQYLHGGNDNPFTQSQADVAAGTTPYTLGFRKAYKLTNGDQTGGAGTNDNVYLQTKLESQDLANSGWNYTSSTSFVTLSFYVKSSVAQNFYGYLRTMDGTGQRYAFETGSLSANTWTKITKTISGNSNLQFDNDANEGLQIVIAPFFGTAFTDSGVSLNTWSAYSSSTRTPDYTSTWYTTNGSTFEVTGVQLEVGSVATDFEHRSFGQELDLCKRYFQIIAKHNSHGNGHVYIGTAHAYGTGQIEIVQRWEKEMRASPSLVLGSGTNYYQASNAGNAINFNEFLLYQSSTYSGLLYKPVGSGTTNGMAYRGITNDVGAYLYLNAEL